MSMQMTKVAKSGWGRFAMQFTASNLYRPAIMAVNYDDENEAAYRQALPFIGITIAKKGKAPNALELSAKQYDPDSLVERLVTIKHPVKLIIERDETGTDQRLVIENEDGAVTVVTFTGEASPEHYRAVVERVAYNLYRQRGETVGGELDDWLEAERTVRMAEFQFDR